VCGRLRPVGKQVPDLRVFRPGRLRHADQVGNGRRLRLALNIRQEKSASCL
jgi:hypothetical protein